MEFSTLSIMRNLKEIGSFYGKTCGWVGLIGEMEEFHYKDKKTNQQNTALKIRVINDGDPIECLLWPNQYKELGKPDPKKIIIVAGIIKEDRKPGQWTMSVQYLKQI